MEHLPLDTHTLDADRAAEPKINRLFKATIKLQASDLHLKADAPARIRKRGDVQAAGNANLSNDQIEEMAFELLTDTQKGYFREHGSIDFAHEVGESDRFRINLFRQRGRTSLAARRVSRGIPGFDALHLPENLYRLTEMHQGLILVAGIAGSGKSTSIAAMIDRILKTRPCHVVTIEDPIEYLFTDDKGFANQREIGIDVPDFQFALKTLMREDPDVVLIGEMRDAETFQAALQAAETGHLVFGTVHASTTAQTLGRVLDLFSEGSRDLVRQSLAFNLRAILCQKLLFSVAEGVDRVPAVELLLSTPIIRKLVEEKRDAEIVDAIRKGYEEGMIDFTESLRHLVEKDFIDTKTAYDAAPSAEELRMRLKGITSGSGAASFLR